MSKIPQLQVENELIAGIVREAVNDRHMSLSEIASLAGLSVTTPARIYHGGKNQVQIKTARRIASALGYQLAATASGRYRFVKETGRREIERLTPVQKERILKTVATVLRKELENM